MNNACGRSTGDCHNCGRTSGAGKRKQLKSRKERNKTRHGGKETCQAASHRHHCPYQGNPDMAHLHTCCRRSHCSSRKDVVPAGQEPSIITDSRLIGHHGLFNHEVKSIDIERLLTNRRKMERGEKQVQKKQIAASHPDPPDVPSPLIGNNLLPGDTGEVVPSEKTPDLITAVRENVSKESSSQAVGITPGQRPRHQPDHMSGSSKSEAQSKDNSPLAVMTENRTETFFAPDNGRGATLSPTCDRETVKTVNPRQKPDIHQTQSHGRSPSPPRISPPPATEASGEMGSDAARLVQSVADRLCSSFRFPNLPTQDLAASTRRLLAEALRRRHGPWLQENLLQLQRRLGSSTACTTEAPDRNQEPGTTDEDGFWSADAFSTRCHSDADSVHRSRGDAHKTAVMRMEDSEPFPWRSSPQLHPGLETTAGWLRSPVETPASSSEDLFRPSSSPPFRLDFEAATTSACGDLFAPSHNPCWGPKAPWQREDGFHPLKSDKWATFDFFGDAFMKRTEAERERAGSGARPSFPREAWLQETAIGDLPFREEHNSFNQQRYSSAPAFPGAFHSDQRSDGQALRRVRRPPGWSSREDVMNYPPSHLLESGPPYNLPSFPSPAHWSYPPLRLY